MLLYLWVPPQFGHIQPKYCSQTTIEHWHLAKFGQGLLTLWEEWHADNPFCSKRWKEFHSSSRGTCYLMYWWSWVVMSFSITSSKGRNTSQWHEVEKYEEKTKPKMQNQQASGKGQLRRTNMTTWSDLSHSTTTNTNSSISWLLRQKKIHNACHPVIQKNHTP